MGKFRYFNIVLVVMVLSLFLLGAFGVSADSYKFTSNSKRVLIDKKIKDGISTKKYEMEIYLGKKFVNDGHGWSEVANPVKAEVLYEVDGSAYDCREYGDNSFSYTDSYNYCYASTAPSTSNYRWFGLLFSEVTLGDSENITIDSANVSVYTNSTSYDDIQAKIKAELHDNPVNFQTNQDIMDSRDYTANYVSWEFNGLGTGWQESPDLSVVIQEVIDSDYWDNGDNIGISFQALTTLNKWFRCYSWDGSATYAPVLFISYTVISPEEEGEMDVNLAIPNAVFTAMIPLAVALILLFVNFFLKSSLVYLVIIACLLDVLFQSEFTDAWIQTGIVILMFFCAIKFFFRIQESTKG